MRFTLPTFNLTVNIWRQATPHTSPPDVVTVGNLAWGARSMGQGWTDIVTGTTAVLRPKMVLLLPKGTDIRSAVQTTTDSVEVPAGTGRFYTVRYVDDIGKGFANEHRAAMIMQSTGWPVPYP